MFVSKSFGYALRGVLYVSAVSSEKKKTVQIDEIAENLNVPKYFLSKIMNKVVKAGILDSTKGQHGGFSINQNTLSTSLLKLVELTGGENLFSTCMLRFGNCNPDNPCPLHDKVKILRNNFSGVFTNNTIKDLMTDDNVALINSISVH